MVGSSEAQHLLQASQGATSYPSEHHRPWIYFVPHVVSVPSMHLPYVIASLDVSLMMKKSQLGSPEGSRRMEGPEEEANRGRCIRDSLAPPCLLSPMSGTAGCWKQQFNSCCVGVFCLHGFLTLFLDPMLGLWICEWNMHLYLGFGYCTFGLIPTFLF